MTGGHWRALTDHEVKRSKDAVSAVGLHVDTNAHFSSQIRVMGNVSASAAIAFKFKWSEWLKSAL